MVVPAFNPSTLEIEEGESLESEDSLVYRAISRTATEKSCLKNNKIRLSYAAVSLPQNCRVVSRKLTVLLGREEVGQRPVANVED